MAGVVDFITQGDEKEPEWVENSMELTMNSRVDKPIQNQHCKMRCNGTHSQKGGHRHMRFQHKNGQVNSNGNKSLELLRQALKIYISV